MASSAGISPAGSDRNVIFTSFTPGDDKSIPEINSFVHTVLHAFHNNLHLELRPDDVWQAHPLAVQLLHQR